MKTQKYHFAIVVLLLGVVLLPVTTASQSADRDLGIVRFTLCQFTSQTPSGSSSLASSGPRVVPYLFLSTHRIFWEADLFKPMLWDFSDIGSRWHWQRDK